MTSRASLLQQSLGAGEFCVTAELVPPLSTDRDAVLKLVEPLQGLVHAVNVTDGAGGRTTMCSLAAAAILADAGFDPVMQLTCRDRNRIALSADLIGAAALGIGNVLLMFGDDPARGDQPEAKAVHDIDTLSLIRLARDLRDKGMLPSGRVIEPPPPFLIGVADIPGADALESGGARLAAKIDAGAGFVQTQMCYDLDLVRRYADALGRTSLLDRVRILIGLGPITSVKSALWMRENLFGVAIPDTLIQRLSDAADPRAEGHGICVELIDAMRDVPGVAGVHLMSPGHSTAAIAALIRDSRIGPGARN